MCPQIYVIFLTQQEPNPGSPRGEEFITAELGRARRNSSKSPKRDQSQTPAKIQPVFQLCRKHISVQVASCRVPPQFVIRTVNAISIERRLASRSA